ncbi:hypothetical protein NEOLEDRAFT_909545 [Neolentinus lepideus HHB14362 ss-1]|uniref:BAH domain-containing protein n=1 Tax=Neolentinus lepideus HHB14362 ss-1 TaxID=1314782 RepID=A0A165UJR8_9AGAM|nr:hypothetical protein NEOLEDRAFT_909545 [Neolentinus lepideus HHB14362 ss-1]
MAGGEDLRRSAARTGMAKKSTVKTNSNHGAPSDAEWEKMDRATAFKDNVVSNEDNADSETFRKGDTAILLPYPTKPDDPLPLHDFWVAKIRGIRHRVVRGRPDVWVRIQWYYSPNDVKAIIKSFDASKCGKYERIFSDDFVTVSSSCFSDLVTVKEYVDSNLDQQDICANEFYMRYDLEHKARIIHPKHIGTCLCGIPYNPDRDLMHLCPRPSCRRWYHRVCLVNQGCVENNTTKRGREDRLLALSPDSDESFPLAAYKNPVPVPAHSRGKCTVTSKGRGKGKSIVHVTPLETLPEELVEIARLPIIKGAKAGGIVGNVRGVVAARRMVYAALEGRELVPEEWEELVTCMALQEMGGREEDEVPPVDIWKGIFFGCV